MMNVNKNILLTIILIMNCFYAASVYHDITLDVSDLNIDKIFSYENQIFITYSDDTSIGKYVIDYNKEELDKVKSLSPNSGDFGEIKDVWITEDIIYVLDSDKVYKINHNTKKQLFEGNSDSYFPKEPYSITISNEGKNIYLIDKKEQRINIMEEYDTNKYLSKGSISMSSHGVQAYFENIVDILSYNGKFYVLDKEAEKIIVYTNTEPYEYVNILAKGKSGYYTKNPLRIEIDEDYIYILENNGQNVTLIEIEEGEKIESFEPECEYGAVDFSVSNNTIYVLCYNKEELNVYIVDKRTTKTEEQVESLYNKIYKEVAISCELYNASYYMNIKIQDKCTEFFDSIENYTYGINYNDEFEELNEIYSKVLGYNSGVIPILNSKIEQNVSYYLNEINNNAPYPTQAKNYTATRIIWDFTDVLVLKNSSEYRNAIEKLKTSIQKYDDFVEEKITIIHDENETINETINEEESDFEKITKQFDYYIPYMENISVFQTSIFELQGILLEIEENESKIPEFEEKFLEIKNRYLEYVEYYNTTKNDLTIIEEEYNTIKSKWFVDLQEIEVQITCAKEQIEINPKEASACIQKAKELIEIQNKESENNVFLGLFIIGILFVVVIFIVLILIGIIKYIKKKK